MTSRNTWTQREAARAIVDALGLGPAGARITDVRRESGGVEVRLWERGFRDDDSDTWVPGNVASLVVRAGRGTAAVEDNGLAGDRLPELEAVLADVTVLAVRSRTVTTLDAAWALAGQVRADGALRARVWSKAGARVYLDDASGNARGFVEVVPGVGREAVRDRTAPGTDIEPALARVFHASICVVAAVRDDGDDDAPHGDTASPAPVEPRRRADDASPAYASTAARLLRPACTHAAAALEAVADPDATGAAALEAVVSAGILPLTWLDAAERVIERATPRAATASAGPSAEPSARDVLLLASDPRGVLTAEALAHEASARLRAWGAPASTRVVWQVVRRGDLAFGQCPKPATNARDAVFRAVAAVTPGVRWRDADETLATLIEGDRLWRRASADRLPVQMVRPAAAQALEPDPDAPRFADLPNPFTPLLEIVALGYVLVALDDRGIRLAVADDSAAIPRSRAAGTAAGGAARARASRASTRPTRGARRPWRSCRAACSR